MKTSDFKKEYIAVLDGVLETASGTINAPIARKENSIIERCIDSSGDTAITHYEVLSSYDNISVVKFILETGRTHQIRVHAKHIGHPIVGDTLYGNPSDLISRQALHSCKINFIHPITKEPQEYVAPIPEDMQCLL